MISYKRGDFMSTGIICEYNPFHNGHLYHINKIKEMFPDDIIVLVMSSHFLQRGDSSLINKWDKTDIALSLGVDIIIELPFVFSSQGADIFAKGSIEILKNMNVDKLVFGSETDDINLLSNIANIQIDNDEFDLKVKTYLDEGISYPTALSKAVCDLTDIKIDKPNDLLAISYIKEIKKQKANIKPSCIKRTNDFHSLKLDNEIVSATSIRNALKENKDIKKYVPPIVYEYMQKDLSFTEDYFDLLKYKIISDLNILNIYHTVDEGIENRIKKYIYTSNNMDELINNIKTKRYTYNKVKRMLTHILCGYTKEEALRTQNGEYIRILGFNEKGKDYLNKVKKTSSLPIITGYSNIKSEILDIEKRVSSIYFLPFKQKNKNYLMEMEYKHKPIIK
jgi:predicted nucleotidyltransferase